MRNFMNGHPTLQAYIDEADKLTEELQVSVEKKRQEMCNKVREEILLPFCRKHGLTMTCGVYSNDFYRDGEEASDYELAETFGIDEEEAAIIEDALTIAFMG